MIQRVGFQGASQAEQPQSAVASQVGAPTAAAPPFRTRMPSFAGPLDLLLYLIHKCEVDIFDIPIVKICDQYLEHLKMLERNGLLDLLQAGEFLVMASRLMEIKSRMLLPDLAAQEDDGTLEEEVEDPRMSLVQQLLEYKEIKERAVLLEHLHDERALRYDRPPIELPELPGTLDLSKTTIWDICAAFDRVLEEADRVAVRVIPFDDTPIEVVIQRIQARIRESAESSVSFTSLFRPELGRPVLISHFLALLEMARLHMVWITQDPDSEEIRILPRQAS